MIKKNSYIFQIVLPVLLPSYDFLRCIASIRAALLNAINYQIVCIVPDINDFKIYFSTDIIFINQVNRGIYEAMNQALDICSCDYIYFLGEDDMMLPSIIYSLNEGILNDTDIILSDVYFGPSKLFRNYDTKYYLIFKNWCHQGIIYKFDIFNKFNVRYPVTFRVQADHYVNIVLSSQKLIKIQKINRCISFYSNSGYSTNHKDDYFRNQFPFLIKSYFGYFFYLIVLIRRKLLLVIKYFI